MAAAPLSSGEHYKALDLLLKPGKEVPDAACGKNSRHNQILSIHDRRARAISVAEAALRIVDEDNAHTVSDLLTCMFMLAEE